MAWRISVSTVAFAMVGMALVGCVLKGGGDADAPAKEGQAGPAPQRPTSRAAISAPSAPGRSGDAPAPSAVAPAAHAIAMADPVAGVDDSLPTGSIDPGSGLHTPNIAAYGDAAKNGSSMILTGAEAINYLAGNTLRREGPGEPLHFTYFASRGIEADGTERGFVARAWNRDRADLCERGPDGASTCRPVEILLDAKTELQGGRLGTVTIGGTATAELIKGNVLHIPQHIPFLDSEVAVDAAATSAAAGSKGLAGWSGLVDHTVAISGEAGGARRFVYYGPDNRLLDIEPVEAGPEGGRAVKVGVGHWRISKAMVCESRAAGDAAQACFKPEPADGGGVRLVPGTKGIAVQRAVALPETRARAVAED